MNREGIKCSGGKGMIPKVSVIVPVYNAQLYLHQCVDSIRHQTLQDIEIILVDDGSTDASGKICDEYAAKDERISVLHKMNGGLVSARKAGLNIATGKYIGYVDADDWIEPDMYASMLEVARRQGADLVASGRLLEIGGRQMPMRDSIEPGCYDLKSIKKRIWPRLLKNKTFFRWGIYPSQCDKLFIREMLTPLQMQVDEEISIGEDTCCVLPYVLTAKKIVLMRDCFYHYRQHPASMVKKHPDGVKELRKFVALGRFLTQTIKFHCQMQNLRHQIRDYLLFIMVPRLTYLLSNYNNQEDLIPFTGVRRGNRVVIYGAGVFGQSLYDYLSVSHFCNMSGWLDSNWQAWRDSGLPVSDPDLIKNMSYDYIVVAVMSENTQQEIKRKMIDMGCDIECIKFVDMDYVRSKKLWQSLNLPEELL